MLFSKHKTFRIIASLFLVSMLMLTGCAGSSSKSGGASPTQGGNSPAANNGTGKTLNVLASTGHQQIFNPLWNKIPQFEKDTGIKVNLSFVPTQDIGAKILQDLRLGGKSYDVIETPDFALSAAAPFMKPLESFFVKDGTKISDWKSHQVGWATDAATTNNEMKYMPYYSGAISIVYRKDLFNDPKEKAAFKAQYGYELPTPPKTRKEFIDVAKFFTRPDGMYGVIFPGNGDLGKDIIEHLTFQTGLPYLDQNNNSLWGPKHPENLNKVAAEASFLTDMVNKYKVTPTSITGMSANETNAFYTSGKAAMLMSQVYLTWNQLNSDTVIKAIGHSDSFVIPAADQDHGGIPFYWAWGMVKDSGKEDAAWTFLKWVTDPENQKFVLKNGAGVYVPTNIDVAGWAVENNILPKGTVDAVQKAQYYPLNTSTTQMRKITQDRYEELILSKITPEEFAKRSGEQIQALMEENHLTK